MVSSLFRILHSINLMSPKQSQGHLISFNLFEDPLILFSLGHFHGNGHVDQHFKGIDNLLNSIGSATAILSVLPLFS
jgi:hypothetical protein